MATAAPPLSTSQWHQVVLHDVPWATYCQLRDEEANNSVRMVYLDGELMLMSPALRHDHPVELVGLIVRVVTASMGQEIMAIRTTTLRQAVADQTRGVGKEPDAAYYIGVNEARMRGRDELDLNVDPPPDLAIEIENTNEVTTTAMAIYARLGVPEVWRLRTVDRVLSIHSLQGGIYTEVARSTILFRLSSALILEALDRYQVGDMGENAWFEWIKAWVRNLPEPAN